MKKALIVVGILVGLLVIGFGAIFVGYAGAMSGFHPIASQRIRPNVTAIRTIFVDSYLVTDGKVSVCFDAGVNMAQTQVELARLHITPEMVRAVFLTHTDSDHTAELSLFPKATVYISTAEEQMINGKTVRAMGFAKNSLPVKTVRLLKDDQLVTVGNIKIRTIATPGHTPGSMSYLVNDRILFSGDTLGLQNGKATLFPSFFNMDDATEKTSITKLAQLKNIALLCTGHHGISTDFDHALQSWRK